MDQAGPGRPSRPASGTAQTLDNDGTATAADGQTAATPEGGQTAAAGVDGPGRTAFSGIRATARHPVAIQLAVLAGFIAAGIAVSWPRVTYLAGRLPATRDAGSYVWGFWWIAHQVEHLGNPWFTRSIDAPAGAQLGLHALLPLPGVLMMPVTIAFGPSASYNLLSIAMPGLFCYAMYRVARLWLPSPAGAIAAGAFFGLSSMLTWRSFYHLNLAAGVLFLPLALAAAVRLTRRPGWRRAVILGMAVGGAILTDQETAVLVIILTCLALLPSLLRRPITPRLWPAALAAGITLLVASPQLVAIIQQARAGGAASPPHALAVSYIGNSVTFPRMFQISPMVKHFGLSGLGFVYHGPKGDGIPTFGLVLSVLAVAGLIVSWRRRSAWLLALLWLGCAALALGPALRVGSHIYVPDAETLNRVRLSAVMPYTWFVHLPGLSGFREASRIMMLGMVPAALLAGAAVNWLRYHAAPVIIVVLALGILESGWSGNPRIGSMPTARPAVDRPIAADHSGSLVVDVPYGLRGGTDAYGSQYDPQAQVLATADGHPRAVGFLSRVPAPTVAAISKHPFFARLVAIQHGKQNNPAQLAAAWQDARHLHIGWVLVWRWGGARERACIRYLHKTGFRLGYQADKVKVYRPAPGPPSPPRHRR